MSLRLSVGDMGDGVVRSSLFYSSECLQLLANSPVLSVGDMGDAVARPSRFSLIPPPELSVGDV